MLKLKILFGLQLKGGIKENKMVKKWIQKALKDGHKGALHRQLNVKPGHKLSVKELKLVEHAHLGTRVRGHKVTGLLKKRAVFALNVRRRR